MARKRSQHSRSAREKEADRLFSILIRLKDTLYSGKVPCYTCDKQYHFKQIECGHYIPRGNLMTRWLEENAKPQCHYCNSNMRGNMTEFTRRLEIESPGLPQRLKELSRETARYTNSDLEALIEHLKTRIDECGGLKKIPNVY